MQAYFAILIISLSFVSAFLYLRLLFQWSGSWRNAQEFVCVESLETRCSPSIIVAFRNEKVNLKSLVSDLKNQTFRELEIIFVDDHSEDGSSGELEQLLIEYNLQAQILKNTGVGKKAALVTGASHAHASNLLFTDADCCLNPAWAKTFAAFLSANKSDVIIGPLKLSGGKTFIERFQILDVLALQLSGGGAALNNKPIMMNGANMLCSKALFLEANLRPEYSSGDDMFLLEYAKQCGASISYLKGANAIVSTSALNGMQPFFKQRIRWASKAKAYVDRDIILSGLIVSFVNGLILLSLVLGVLELKYLAVWSLLFIVKMAGDSFLLNSGKAFFQCSFQFKDWLISQLLYPFYVLIVLFFSLTVKVKWKGRDVS